MMRNVAMAALTGGAFLAGTVAWDLHEPTRWTSATQTALLLANTATGTGYVFTVRALVQEEVELEAPHPDTTHKPIAILRHPTQDPRWPRFIAWFKRQWQRCTPPLGDTQMNNRPNRAAVYIMTGLLTILLSYSGMYAEVQHTNNHLSGICWEDHDPTSEFRPGRCYLYMLPSVFGIAGAGFLAIGVYRYCQANEQAHDGDDEGHRGNVAHGRRRA